MWKAARQCGLIDWSGKIVDRTALESTWTTDLAVAATAAAAGNTATAATQSRAGDTDTAPENSQTPTQDTDPAVAATAAASSELTNSSLLAFPLENAPTAAWVSAITQSQAQSPWLSTMISSYTTFRHLLNDCVDPGSGVWSEQSFYNNGVTESTDRIALQRWANANWERYLAYCPKPPPPPPPPPPPLPPAPVVAATAATVPAASAHATATCRSSWLPQLSDKLAGLLLSKIDVPGSWSSDEQPPLSSGLWKIAGVDVLVRFGPEAPRDCKRAIVFLPGTDGYSTKFLEAMHRTCSGRRNGSRRSTVSWLQFRKVPADKKDRGEMPASGEHHCRHTWTTFLPGWYSWAYFSCSLVLAAGLHGLRSCGRRAPRTSEEWFLRRDFMPSRGRTDS